MYISFHVKYSLLLSCNLTFLDRFAKNTQISNFIEIRAVGDGLFHADGQTDGQADTTKLIVAFSNFAKAPKTACPRKLKTLNSAKRNPAVRKTSRLSIRELNNVKALFCPAVPDIRLQIKRFRRVYTSMEQLWHDMDRGKPTISEKRLSECNSVHCKSHTDWFAT